MQDEDGILHFFQLQEISMGRIGALAIAFFAGNAGRLPRPLAATGALSPESKPGLTPA